MKSLLLLLLLFIGSRAFCCSCTGEADDSNGEMNLEWISQFSVVFTARIDSVISPIVDDQGMPKSFSNFYEEVYLTIQSVYKGSVPAHLKITPPHYGSSCEFRLQGQQGKVYIFYGIQDEDGSIYTHFCLGSKPFISINELDTLQVWANAYRQEVFLLSSWDKHRNGQMTFRYSNGQTMGGGKLKNGNQEGPWTCYNYFGKITSKGDYLNGLRSGKWEEYLYVTDYDTRTKKYAPLLALNQSGNYVRGLRSGLWTEFRYKEMRKRIRGKVKTIKVLYPCEKGIYTNGMKEGEWVSLDQNGTVTKTAKYREGISID